MTRTVLVLGAGGALGRALVGALGEVGRPVVALDRAACDLVRPSDVDAALERHRPACVINAAAFTGVDAAEAERERATLINATVPGLLATRCARAGIAFVHYSTDFVFDGAAGRPYVESDVPRPLNAYGATKLAGERAVQDAWPRALVLRTAWLYGDGGRNFPSTVRARLAAGERVSAERDRIGSPTWTGHLAAFTLAALDAGATGVIHAAGGGTATWWDFAIRLCDRLHADRALVEPFDPLARPRAAHRPDATALASERTTALGLAPLPAWELGQDAYLAHGGDVGRGR